MLSFNAYKSFPKHRCPCIPQIVTRYTSAFTNFKMSSTFLLEPGATEKGYFVSKYLGIFQIAFNDWFLVRSLVRENALYGWLRLHLRRLVLSPRMWAWWVSHAHLRRAPVLLLGGALVHEHQVSHAAWWHCPRLLRLSWFHVYVFHRLLAQEYCVSNHNCGSVCPFKDITVRYLNLEAAFKGTHIQYVMCSWTSWPLLPLRHVVLILRNTSGPEIGLTDSDISGSHLHRTSFSNLFLEPVYASYLLRMALYSASSGLATSDKTSRI